MDEKELFEQNPWWKGKEYIEEDYDIIKWNEKKYRWIPNIVEQITLEPFAFHTIIGPRQAGKTTVAKLLIKKLLSTNNPKEIFYFNCDDLADYKELESVINSYLFFKDNNSIKKSIIILDEITSPKEWYRAIKFLIDKGKLRNDILIVTGSSSLSVKKEVELFPGRRGKGRDYILYPLSFRSFLKVIDPILESKLVKIINIEELEKLAVNAMSFEKELHKHLKDYMDYGGFPLSVANLHENKEEAKRTYLNWVKNAILKNDRSESIARQIIKSLIESLQSDVSWESISKKIEVKSPKTVSAYIDFMKSIFVVNILYNLDIGSRSIKFGRNKKIHFRDPLLVDIFEDWCLIKSNNKESAIAESLVIEHLIRMFVDKVFFWRNGTEVDAVVYEKGKLYGFEVKFGEDYEAEFPNNFKKSFIITRKDYSRNPRKIPLAVFLSLFDV
jgi:predicted AAA+ superfamily ATPase